MAPDQKEFVRSEVQKLLDTNIIKEVNYSDWVANVVLATKENCQWHHSVNYTGVNRACPKDLYPLPPIDQLVDATV